MSVERGMAEQKEKSLKLSNEEWKRFDKVQEFLEAINVTGTLGNKIMTIVEESEDWEKFENLYSNLVELHAIVHKNQFPDIQNESEQDK